MLGCDDESGAQYGTHDADNDDEDKRRGWPGRGGLCVPGGLLGSEQGQLFRGGHHAGVRKPSAAGNVAVRPVHQLEAARLHLIDFSRRSARVASGEAQCEEECEGGSHAAVLMAAAAAAVVAMALLAAAPALMAAVFKSLLSDM